MKILASLMLLFVTSVFAQDTLEIWTSSEPVKKAIDSASAGFEKEYGAKIKVTVLSKDLTSQFKTAALAGKGPDIFAWAHDVIGDLAESGLVEPIILSPELKKAFIPVALSAYTYKGQVYGYPYDLEAVAMVYNKKLIAKVPETMEEVIAFSEATKAKNNGSYGFLYDIGNFFFSFPFLSAGGGYIFKDTNGNLNTADVGLANAGAVSGLEFINSLKQKGIVPESTDRSNAFALMKEGKLAMMIDGPWAINDLKSSGVNYGIALLPTIKGNRPKPFVGAHGFIIRRSSKNKELAKILIEEYLVSKKGVMALYQADPRGPARLDVLAEVAKTNVDLATFLKSAEGGIPMPNVPAMGAVWGAMGNAISLTLSGKETPKKALEHAKTQILSKTK